MFETCRACDVLVLRCDAMIRHITFVGSAWVCPECAHEYDLRMAEAVRQQFEGEV